MYGMAKGAGSSSSGNEYGLDFEVIYDSSIKRINTGPSVYLNQSITRSGLTVTYGSSEDSKISFSGRPTDSCSFPISGGDSTTPPSSVKNTTFKAGYYCFDANRNENLSYPSRAYVRLKFGVSSLTHSFEWDLQDTTSFYLSEDVGPIGAFSYIIYISGSSSFSYTDRYTQPRLYYLGENPFSKMARNTAVFIACSAPTSNPTLLLTDTSYTPSTLGTVIRLTAEGGANGNDLGKDGWHDPVGNLGYGCNIITSLNRVDVVYRNASGSTATKSPESFLLTKEKSIPINGTTTYSHLIHAIKTV